MANHASAEKRNRQRVKSTDRNRAIKSTVRTKIKSARAATATTPAGTDTKKLVTAAVSSIDKACSKGVLHARTAARKKARLARALHKALTAAK
jgi:small subunit ribosomal protein S20